MSSLTGSALAVPQDQEVLLPRWREGGTPPDDPNQKLVPFSVKPSLGAADMPPTSGLIASPPEYSPCDGVIFRYTTGYGNVVVACVAALTGSPAYDEKAYVVVSSAAQQTTAANAFAAAGADLSKVVFFIEPTDSVWLRDYGPHFVWQSNTLTIADSHYYPTRPLDNFIPTLLANNHYVVPPYPMGLYYSGGNFQPGPNRSGFITSLINSDNPDLSNTQIADLYRLYQGIDTLHIMPRLPSTVDGTGHIDMWMYLVDDHTCIISQFKAGSNPTAIQVTDNAVPYMQALGFNVYRTPAWNVGSTHYTYTNAFRVNNRIFTISYASGNPAYAADDAAAAAAWQAAAGPGVTLVPINCYNIIPSAGAIHCIVMQVPRYTDPNPSVHVLNPDGGEAFAMAQTYDLQWSATDDETVSSVDLFYSTDGGATYPFLIAAGLPDTGHYSWKIPLKSTPNAKVRAVAYDNLGNSATADSTANFEMTRTRRKVYDFGTGAGVNKWAWGASTTAWSAVNGVRYPATASTEIEVLKPGAYAQIASSNATGGDADANRYVSPIPASGSESTHVFEFLIAEAPSCIVDLELLWEGYGDDCLQMELYVWDNVANNWSDAKGVLGANAYAANYSGNADGRLEVHIRQNLANYIDANGRLTFMLYAERATQESFCDYVSVATLYKNCP
ncbi:MAG: agmatine deiminase family protein [Planctomycetes bacterium]|nr:agmatine deiminase family protein [Planctomycetota bacterium]